MLTIVGFAEFLVFLYLASRTLYDTDNIIDNIIYCYLCQIINYKIFGGLAWLSFGISLYPSDCTVILMFIIMIRGFKITFPRKNVMIIFMIFLLMAAQSCVRGLMAFGFSSEWFADLRKYVYFSMGILYFWCVPLEKEYSYFERKIDTVFKFLTCYTLFILAFYFAGMQLGENGATRPLLADYAIIYAAYTAFRWYRDLVMSERGTLSFWTLLCTVTLIFNRFNTTWVALFVAVAILLVFRRLSAHNSLPGVFYAQCVVIAIVAAIFASSNNIIMQNILESAEKFNADESNTYSSRMELWQSLMTTVTGIYAFIGHPFGNGFHAAYRNWQATPHNGYLETLLRCGYIGIVSLVTYMVSGIVHAFKKRYLLPIMMCAVCMVFWYAYSLTFEQGCLIGVCMEYIFLREEYDDSELYAV